MTSLIPPQDQGCCHEWLREAHLFQGVLYTKETEQEIQTIILRRAQERRDRRLQTHIEELKQKGRGCLTFGPSPKDRVTKVLKVANQPRTHYGIKWPLSKLRQMDVVVGSEREARFTATVQKSLISWFLGERPMNVSVKTITDEKHPAYNSIKSSYRLCAKVGIQKWQLVGAPYAGVIRSTKETDDLELHFPTAGSSGGRREDMSLFNRWSYAWAISQLIPPHGEGEFLEEVSDDDETKSTPASPGMVKSRKTQRLLREIDLAPDAALEIDPDCVRERHRILKATAANHSLLIQDVAIVPEKNSEDMVEGMTFNLDATEIRNELALANDPENMGAVMGFNKAFEVAANVEAIWCWVYNIPHLVYVAKRKILAKEEILVDYGSGYWEKLRMLSATAEEYRKAVKEKVAAEEAAKELTHKLLIRRSAASDQRQRLTSAVLEQKALAKKLKLAEVERLKAQHKMDATTKAAYDAVRKAYENATTVVSREKATLAEYEKELHRAQTSIVAHEKKVNEVEQKRDAALAQIAYVTQQLRATEEQRRKLETDRLAKEAMETLGGTTSSKVQAVCIYSLVAESMGEGASHVTGDRPDNHFASGCKFAKNETIRAHVILCGECNGRYRAGVGASELHKFHCARYKQQRVRRMYEESLECRLSERAWIEERMMNVECAELDEMTNPQSRRQLYADESLNELIVQSLLDGFEQNMSIVGLMRALVSTIIKTTGDCKGVGDELLTRCVASALEIPPEDVPPRLNSLYALSRLISDPKLRLQHLNASTPAALQWLFPFSEEMCLVYQSISSKCDKASIYTESFVENLTTLLRTAHDRAVAYRETATQPDLQTGLPVPSLYIETRATLKPLADQIASLYAQLPWPERPLPKMSNPFRPTAAEWREKIAGLRAKGLPVKEEPRALVKSEQLKRMKPETYVDLEATDSGQEEGIHKQANRPNKQLKIENVQVPTQDPKVEIFLIDKGQDLKSRLEWSDHVAYGPVDEDEDEAKQIVRLNRAGLKGSVSQQLTMSVPGVASIDSTKYNGGIRFSSPETRLHLQPGICLKAEMDWAIEMVITLPSVDKARDAPKIARGLLRPGEYLIQDNTLLSLSSDVPLLSLAYVWRNGSGGVWTLISVGFFVFSPSDLKRDYLPLVELSPSLQLGNQAGDQKCFSSPKISRLLLCWRAQSRQSSLTEVTTGQTFRPVNGGRMNVHAVDDALCVDGLGCRHFERSKIEQLKVVQSRLGKVLATAAKNVDLFALRVWIGTDIYGK